MSDSNMAHVEGEQPIPGADPLAGLAQAEMSTPETRSLEQMLAHIHALRKEAEHTFPQNIPSTLTFSTVRNTLDSTSTAKDSDLIAILTRPASRQPIEWDAIHFLIAPNTLTPTHPGYDKILFRHTIISNLALSIQKQNAAEQHILGEGFTILHAVPDANVLLFWDFLFGPLNPKRETPQAHKVYHDHLSPSAMTIQYEALNSLNPQVRAKIESGQRAANNDPLADPDKSVLQRRYLKPCYVRDLDEGAVLQAWEGMMGSCMIFLVRDLEGREFGAYACFRDVVVGDGEEMKVDFEVDVWYQEANEQGGAKGFFKKSGV